MSRINRIGLLFVTVVGLALLGGQSLCARGGAGQGYTPAGRAFSHGHSGGMVTGYYLQPSYFPSMGGYGWSGGYYSPFVSVPSLPPAGYSYLPNYWWVGPYPEADPRQAGYNPASGYPRDSVTTLILVTDPVKSRVILNGIFVGTADYLGPIQLPFGEHTLRVEAAGYEPSETVLNVEQPILQQLQVRLKPAPPQAKSAPPF
jgi:hypothetical protein